MSDTHLPTTHITIVTGGAGSFAPEASAVGPRCVVIAADGGLDVARRAGLVAHHLVGDLDSVSMSARAWAEESGVAIHRHPADKDATDLELALDLAVELLGSAPPAEAMLRVVGPGAGRLDLLLGDVGLLAAPRLGALEVRASFGPAHLVVVPAGARRSLHAAVGEQLSLLPMHGPARAVTTDGLRWALRDADLPAGTSRGLSNEVVHPEASVAVGEGTVVVVRPGTRAPNVADRATAYDPSPRTLDPPEEPS